MGENRQNMGKRKEEAELFPPLFARQGGKQRIILIV